MLLLLVAGFASAAAAARPGSVFPYPFLDPSLSAADRIKDVLPRVPLQAKINTLQTSHEKGIPGSGIPSSPGYIVLPKYTIETYATSECLHGYCSAANMTVFAHSCTLAASFNAPLLRLVGAKIGEEARAVRNAFEAEKQFANKTNSPNGLACFSPQINIVRDPRWGRAQETYGEDPYLTAALAYQYVQGMQGQDPEYIQVIASPKHYDAYGGATTRGHRSPTEVSVSWRDWQETFLPQFHAAIAEAGALSTMCSYNTLCLCDSYPCSCPGPSHGIPACANHELLTTVLRDQWKSKAYVVSDAGAIKFAQTDHEYAPSQPAAAADALIAGADLALGGGYSNGQPQSFAALAKAVELGLTNASMVDVAFSRIFYARLKLGLLDPPGRNPYTRIPRSAANSPENRALAVRTAQEGMVLLTNPKNTLPLQQADFASGPAGKLAVVGPNSDLIAYGNYAGHNDNNTTPVQGIARIVPTLAWAKGCTVAGVNKTGFPAALAAAKMASVTVAIFGIDSSQEHETGTRSIVTLPGVQEQLLEGIAATGTKLVLVLIGGSAMSIPNWVHEADAILLAGYGGEEAGTGLADVLFGHYNPAGRLPYTVPTGLGQLPPFESYQMDRGSCGSDGTCGRTYRYMDKPPLFHFGSGQSYTTFTTRNLVTSSAILSTASCSGVNVTVEVSNVGQVAGDEVTQVYISRNGTMAPAPPIALAAFARTHLKAGAKISLTLEIRPIALAVVEPKARRGWTLQPCTITIYVGGRQPSAPLPDNNPHDKVQATTVGLLGPVTLMTSCPRTTDAHFIA